MSTTDPALQLAAILEKMDGLPKHIIQKNTKTV